MPNIKFKVKCTGGVLKVPRIKSHHCEMHEFRISDVFGSVSNTPSFEPIVNRAVRKLTQYGYIELDNLPACVTVITGSLLASVTINLK
jgi:hypothetical protein